MLLESSTLNNLVPELVGGDFVSKGIESPGRWRTFVTSLAFECAVALLIVYSSITLVLWIDKSALPELFFAVSDVVVSFLFLLEWCTRLWLHGSSAFLNAYFLFFTFLAFVPGLAVSAAITIDVLSHEVDEYSWLGRTIEVLRTARVLHILRLFEFVGRLQHSRFFPELWLLLRGFRMSMSVLLSALSLMTFCLYMFAIAAVDLIGSVPDSTFTSDVNQTYADAQAQQAFNKFRNLRVAFTTLARILNFDDAQIVIDWLHGHLPGIGIFFWGAFIPIMSFVLLNLVTAVIVQQALDIARADEVKFEQELEDESIQELQTLHEELRTAAAPKDGQLTLKVLHSVLGSKSLSLQTQAFTREDLEDLFHLLDVVQHGRVDVDEFTKAIGQLNGQAKSTDMVLLVEATNHILKQMERLHNTLDMEAASTSWHSSMISRLEKLDESVGHLLTGCAADATMAMEELQALEGAVSKPSGDAEVVSLSGIEMMSAPVKRRRGKDTEGAREGGVAPRELEQYGAVCQDVQDGIPSLQGAVGENRGHRERRRHHHRHDDDQEGESHKAPRERRRKTSKDRAHKDASNSGGRP
mmetsp:Transcript_4917/g.10862  ORF Transcript_4917/g.10862 Transcript_4917/m.10862 type:complete len:582 (-) Transcript_4917:322-2067(-)